MILLSVIIPFHDDIERLKDAVNSVCCQKLHGTPIAFEIVISNDSILTPSEIRHMVHRLVPDAYSLVVLNNKYKRGPGGNRNSAIEVSTGSYIAFLDSDDTWQPSKTYLQYQKIKQGANFVTTAYSFSEDGTAISPPARLRGSKSVFYSWSPIGTSTVIVSKHLLRPTPFSDLWFCQDLVLWSQIIGNPACVYSAVDQALVNYTRNSGRTSRSSIFESFEFFYAAANYSGLTFPESLLAAFVYSIRGVINKVLRPLVRKFKLVITSPFRKST
jgi:glycosyltransferase involved in cell wall biosynthesis